MSYEMFKFMEHLAIESGRIIMGFWGTDVRSKFKDDKTVVTEADLRVKDFIKKEMLKTFPVGVGLLTEETYEKDKNYRNRLGDEKVIIVDELDGSGDFKRKEEDFCFLIAYAVRGVPQIGIVYEPLKERMFYAEEGGKAIVISKGDESELPQLKPVRWENSMIGHPKNHKGDKYKTLYELMEIPKERLVHSGSIGTRMMQVAMQQSHIILGYTKKMGEWDIAAGQVILEAMGISVTDIYGNPLVYNKPTPKAEKGILIVHPDIKQVTLEKLTGCYSRLEM